MKVGLLTLHRGTSHGGFLQTYALSTFLKSLGHSVEVVDYFPPHRQEHFRLFNKMDSQHYGINRTNLRALRRLPAALRRNDAFRNAVKLLPLSTKQYKTLDALQDSPPEYDACFFGSDQIWNPRNTGRRLDPAYFGAFGPTEMKRIAYAASFGTAMIDERFSAQLEQLLGCLDTLSVREASGIEILATHSNRSAVQMIDPTFLISPEAYPPSRTKAPAEPYVFGYFLQNSSHVKRAELIRTGERTKLRVLNAANLCLEIPSFDPRNLLEFIRNASYLVTDSFHGLALALANEVPFTLLGLEGDAAARNERLLDLVRVTGVEERFRLIGATEGKRNPIELPVDWKRIHGVLSTEKNKATAYISNSLRQRHP